MKILHLVNTLLAGGAELQMLTLCTHLKEMEQDIMVAFLKGRPRGGARFLGAEFEAAGITPFNLGADSRFDWRFLPRTSRVIDSFRPEIIHTHLPRADLAGFLGKRRGSKWVCSIHGIYSTFWSGAWALNLWSRIWRRADRVVAISHAVADWLVTGMNIPPSKITVIHYGIEGQLFSSPAQDLRGQLGYHKDVPIIGTIARLEPGKGLEYLIKAFPLVLGKFPSAVALVAGTDHMGYSKKLMALIQSLGLDGKVRLLGFQDDVVSFLHAIDIFAFPSLSEGFGQVVIEAMAASRAVVANRIGPLTEIVVEGETGLLVEPRDPYRLAEAVCRLLARPEEARSMGAAGKKRVEGNFSAPRMAQGMLQLYQEVL
ncbi:MAG: glycosyltransferase [Candidatus Aenigmarchaeota archaeon]|nr:glycosyltransferase [Candidatus Aenigmarchaeota archaeon]